MQKTRIPACLTFLALLVCLCPAAAAISTGSQNYASNNTIASGGGANTTSTGFYSSSALSQVAIGNISSSNYITGLGFFNTLNSAPSLTSVSSNVSVVNTSDSIRITTSGASDDEGDQLRLECGNSSGSSNLCTGAYGSPERTCDFTSPWTNNGVHTVYCRVFDGEDSSPDRTVQITSQIVYNCTSCSDCSAKIASASSFDVIQLNASISNYVGTADTGCINFGGKDNVTFDCLGNTIDGDDSGTDYGIWLNSSGGGSNSNTIRNCTISDFYYGLHLDSSHANGIYGVTATSNEGAGFAIEFSSNNTLANITSSENTIYDLYVYTQSDSDCNNKITNATSSGGRSIKYYNSSINLSNETLSQLILCNADNSSITNVTITGSTSVRNNALFLVRTDYSNFSNINSSYRYNGVYSWGSSNNIYTNITVNNNAGFGMYINLSSNNNTFTDIKANSNSWYGINIKASAGNVLSNSTLNYNSYYGLVVWFASNNTFTNITASNNQEGARIYMNSEYNAINNSRMQGNTVYGIYLYSFGSSYPRYNTFYNNYLNNTVNLYSDSSSNSNYWNITLNCSRGPNIIGGPCVGGNYWTNSAATGFSDTCTDSNWDGICDSSYAPATNNTDYYPLSEKPPQMRFVSPTLNNQSTTANPWVFVNVSANETLSWCTLNWYNGTWQNVSMTVSGHYCYVNMTGLSQGNYYFRVYGNDSTGHMNMTEDRQVAYSILQVQNTRLISPSLLVARENESMNSTTTVKYVAGANPVYMINITSEVPWDFGAPSAGNVRVYFVDYAPYGRRDITGNASVDVQVVDQSGSLPTLVMVNISSLWLTDAGGNMSVNDYIEVFYLMNSSQMAPNEYRTAYTNSTLKDTLSATGSASILNQINSSEIVLRGYKSITQNPSNPQNFSVEMIMKSIGGPVSGILLSDYLPQGATLTGMNVTYYNQSTGATKNLVNGSDYYVANPSQAALPDGTLVDVYYYNFSYKYANWNGNLYDNDSITIRYNATVLGGGQWVLPAIISGYDPTYKTNIVTETSAPVNVPLFDVILETITKTVKPGDMVRAALRMMNVGGPRAQVDVLNSYSIKTMTGQLIIEKSETFAVTNEKEKELSLQLPSKTGPGMYTFETLVTYAGREALSTDTFMVMGNQAAVVASDNTILYIAIIILAVVVIATLLIKRKPRSSE